MFIHTAAGVLAALSASPLVTEAHGSDRAISVGARVTMPNGRVVTRAAEPNEPLSYGVFAALARESAPGSGL